MCRLWKNASQQMDLDADLLCCGRCTSVEVQFRQTYDDVPSCRHAAKGLETYLLSVSWNSLGLHIQYVSCLCTYLEGIIQESEYMHININLFGWWPLR